MRILINNFFSGVLERGIPIYCKNLRLALESDGHHVVEVCCPRWALGLPKAAQNILFVLFEQLLIPIISIFYSRVIYPYNTTSLLGSLHPGALLIVHDFIPNRSSNKSLVAKYVRLTQGFHAEMGRDVAFVSSATYKVALRLGVFSDSKQFVLPNGFWTFRAAMEGGDFTQGNYVLLCTGSGKNKDLHGALKLYAEHLAPRHMPLYILGLAGDRTIVSEWLSEHPAVNASIITILPRLTDVEVVEAYMGARWVWVHSRNEGYGRSIAEAKCCGRYTVATNIPPFREQRDSRVYLYWNSCEFVNAVGEVDSLSDLAFPSCEPAEDRLLVNNLRFWLGINL